MKNPGYEAVREDLGDKIVNALSQSVAGTKQWLAVYREKLPDVVVNHTGRALANWIHDELWRHSCTALEGIYDVRFRDNSVTREIIVREKYRIRLKRHHQDNRISSYPTQAALDFYEQPPEQLVLEGLEQTRLVFGYRWNADSREIGSAVISLWDRIDNLVWIAELPEPEGVASVQMPVRSESPDVTISVRLDEDEGGTATVGGL